MKISATNLGHRCVLGRSLRYARRWIPENGSTYSGSDEPGDAGCASHPFTNLFVILAPAEDDATHFLSTSTAGGSYKLVAGVMALEPFDFPHVGFAVGILQLLDCSDHQPGANLQVMGLVVSAHLIEVRLFRGH